MKKILLFILIIALVSCKEDVIENIRPDTFINGPGIYYFGGKQLRLKSFEDGCLLFGVADIIGHNNFLYQQSIFMPFSKYHKWILYLDKDENIWSYNGDFQESKLLLYDTLSKNYIVKDFEKEKLTLPKKFEDRLKN